MGIGKVAASLGGVLLVWWAATTFGEVNPVLVPGPALVWAAAVDLWNDGTMGADLRVSLGRAAIGFGIGSALGVLVGLLTARTRLIGAAVTPVLTLLRPIPAIALVPLAIVWFGIGEGSKWFVIAYTVFLAVWLNTHHGASHVPGTFIRASRSLGAGAAREFFEVVLPAAAPHITAGLRMGAALAFLSLVAAELTGSSAGIGFRIQEARQFMQTEVMFVNLILLGVLGALLDAAFVSVSRRVVHWEGA
ncbi:ABC transporter permease [Roseococcus sp. DSY-14]|uniref:ABC transporter permease n=1 Tax=Roseococcus sp. DSY-14 TaxID=3369650 RepID=UPI00387AA675